ncbi:MAG: D-alanyl-D-alanine carboxypeptidase [Proteobacteria bacterium]|nr:D-alanyl-D-alanine carboxypeptidase [Pseudomonadota bacterium]
MPDEPVEPHQSIRGGPRPVGRARARPCRHAGCGAAAQAEASGAAACRRGAGARYTDVGLPDDRDRGAVRAHRRLPTVEQLIRGVIIQSGNDACIVLAEGLSGSEEAFAESMNKLAKAMGMRDTNFRNSTGYPDPDHYSTARDLAILAKRSVDDHPEYYKMYAEREYTYNNIRQGNRNPLLYKSLGVDGLKTGHTEAAGYGLVASASREGGRRITMVLNGLPSIKVRASESERLLDWAYREFENYTLFKAGDTVDNVDVWLGNAKSVALVAGAPLTATLPRKARREMRVTEFYDTPINAPIRKGDTLARLVITAPGVDPIELPLIAGADVERLGAFGRLGAAMSYLVFGSGR